MSLINNIFLNYNKKILRDLDKTRTAPIGFQEYWFKKILQGAHNTKFGTTYNIDSIKSISSFQKNIPIMEYDTIAPYIKEMLCGEQNILTNKRVNLFSKSSGTSSDKSKYIPITEGSLHITHYGGFKAMLATYISQNRGSKIFSGKALTLGGSNTITSTKSGDKIYTGDLSGILIKEAPFIIELLRTPKREGALISNFNKKIEYICKHCSKENVTNFSGVPSWNLVLINNLLKYCGAKDLLEIWPNIELFMHGGIGFEPYKEIYKTLIPSNNMHYLENYNASEGYFAFQDSKDDNSMLLTTNNGIFYEFIELDKLDEALKCKTAEAYTINDVKVGVDYAIIISTIGGLWRYLIGDTVRFTSTYPHKIVITGRTKLFINAFGEELMISNAEKAIYSCCRKHNCSIADFTVAPVFMQIKKDNISSKGYHHWAIEFITPPSNIEEFTNDLDYALTQINSDYGAKRDGDATMLKLKLSILKSGTFYKWMQKRSKLGGQNKVPRLNRDLTIINQLLELEDEN